MNYTTKHFNIFILSTFLILNIFALLITRINDEGYNIKETPVIIQDTTWNLGYPLFTDEDIQLATWNDSEIWMDKRTDVFLLNNRENISLRLDQGRILVRGDDIEIHVRDIEINVNGTASFVHYSWLNQLTIIPVEGETRIKIDGEELILDTVVNIETLSPYKIENADFDMMNVNCAAFYKDSRLLEGIE